MVAEDQAHNECTRDVVALGELLIDFTPHGVSDQGQLLFERNPGGAPANVLAALAKLQCRTSFIGAVGEDSFGYYLKDVLTLSKIGTEGLVFTKEAGTTLAFVHLAADGDRSFSFYRQPGADYMLREEDVNLELIRSASIFHYGSISMTHEPSRTATLSAAAYAKSRGLLISYDPNLRLSLWENEQTAKDRMTEGLEYADVVKLSEEELLFLTGTSELELGTKQLTEQYPSIGLLLVTLGPGGSYCRAGNITASHGGFCVEVQDTTGAGDAFFAGILFTLLGKLGHAQKEWTMQELRSMLAFANAMGALATTGKGAIPSMPTIQEVRTLAGADIAD
ncbi:fructokinase [Paenibacillus castaneae]|uniref:PfkB family carbohydrate kinase n=1 Tax=Paenibacillus castaneae TaxID=474957 RepID=UPI000C9D036E|nr:PfkB family carbohydrate kinase [Paenibacillus castaneae]NIK75005.1 fructokinase [Paenibacillus castaneae]